MARMLVGETLVAARAAHLGNQLLCRGASSGRKRRGAECSRRRIGRSCDWTLALNWATPKPMGDGARARTRDAVPLRMRGLLRSTTANTDLPHARGQRQLVQRLIADERGCRRSPAWSRSAPRWLCERATMSGKRWQHRGRSRDRWVLCTTTSKRRTRSPLVYAFSVSLPKCNLNTVRSYTGVSSTTSNRGRRFQRHLRATFMPNRRSHLTHIQSATGPVNHPLKDLLHLSAAHEQEVTTVFDLIDRVRVVESACVPAPQCPARSTNRSNRSTVRTPGSAALWSACRPRCLRSVPGARRR